jgi:tetratricopeptide (TPR) repeat protein
LGALLSTNQPAAVSNLLTRTTGISVAVTDPNDPLEKEYQKLLEQDDAAQEEVDRWIKDNQAFREQGAGLSDAALNLRIEQRVQPVLKGYDEFLQNHPKHVRARLAYGSFLMDIGDEEQAESQWNKAREIDPKNPATWNNLANQYGHRGPVKKAFEYYAKALELDPKEPVYYQNLATTVFLFRKDAMEFYQIDEQQVFTKALEFYRQALDLDPTNFPLATDLAQTYYGIKPPRTEDALKAWQYALKITSDEIEREGVYVHLARIELNSGRFDQARTHLNLVTNQMYDVVKGRLTKNLAKAESGTNATSPAPLPPAEPNKSNPK